MDTSPNRRWLGSVATIVDFPAVSLAVQITPTWSLPAPVTLQVKLHYLHHLVGHAHNDSIFGNSSYI